MIASMAGPSDDIDGMLAAHRRLSLTMHAIDDEVVRRPSLLPDWTVAHVLTHIARNADSITRRLVGAARGEIVDQYPGGAAGREAEIVAGAGRSAAALVEDVAQAADAVEAAVAAHPDDAWQRLARNVAGVELPVSTLPFTRWREVEVHHADLGLDFGPADWSDGLIDRWLPTLVAALPARTDGRQLLAWALGRRPAPELDPWG
jgi:maleylpyruvate isomerase